MAVVEALSDEEAYLVCILTDQSGLDLAEFSWYAPESEDGCWRARPYQWAWWRCPDPLQIDQCVAAGQRVTTARGLVAIEDVRAGDLVRTHRGRWRRVVRTWAQGEQDVVRVSGADVDVTVTAAHELWALRQHRAGWVRARDLAASGAAVRLSGKAWVPVAVAPAGRAAVYDLEVEEDHSFVVEGVAVHNCARDVGKTTGMIARANAFPFCHPGGEMVVTAPELVHLMPVTDAIERVFHNTRLCTEMMPRGRSKMVRRPFRMNFTTGARIIGRIPQVTGRAVKGLHPVALEMDECFPADTLILTRRGLVPICDVVVGDEVLTHRMRWRRVNAVLPRGERAAVVVRGQGHPGLVVTPNHRFWAKRILRWRDARHQWGPTATTELTWVAAEDLEGCYWASPSLVPDVVDVMPVIPRSATGASYSVDTTTPAFLFLLGLYIAEGSTSSSYGTGGPTNRASWSVHRREVEEVLGYMAKAGIVARPQPVQSTPLCVNVVVSHGGLAPWLADACGSGALHKRVPPAVFGLDEDGRQAVLDGVVFGDGFGDPDDRYAPGRWKVTTASKALAIGLRLLGQSLGYHVSLYQVPPRVSSVRGRPVRGSGWYQVVGNRRGQGVDEGQFRLTRVRSVGIAPGRRLMYDLTVEDDQSFVADGLVVHNSQDYPEAGWTELKATLRRGVKGAMWRAHGVTRGIRDTFWEFTQPGPNNPWKVHRIVAMHRDDWGDAERQSNIQLYGSREAPDYRRNILGLHGDPANALFVLSRLMRCVDLEEASEYNTEEYRRFLITAEQLEEMSGAGENDDDAQDWAARQAIAAIQILDIGNMTDKYELFWGGMDVGYTIDPSEILIAAEYMPTAAELRVDRTHHRAIPEKGVSRLRVVCRIQLKRVSNPVQVAIVAHVVRTLKVRAFGLDKTGAGLPLFMDLQALDNDVATVVRGYNFSEKVIVGIDGTVEVTEQDDVLKEAALRSNVLEFSTDTLREYVDKFRWMMPFDRDVIREFQGQTWSWSKALNAMDAYGRPRRVFSKGNFHALSAARMLAMAHTQAPIEEIVKNLLHPQHEAVMDLFLQ